MESRSYPLIFVVGAPGSGKETLCKRLAEEHDLKHISVGDLLRQIVASPAAAEQGSVHAVIGEYMLRGKLLPADILFAVLQPAIETAGRGDKVVLVDGFPRHFAQANLFEYDFGRPDQVLFFDCPRDIAETRVLTRNVGRVGDDAETFARRYREFTELNSEIVAHYEAKRLLVTVDTSGKTEVSYTRLLESLRGKEWMPKPTATWDNRGLTLAIREKNSSNLD